MKEPNAGDVSAEDVSTIDQIIRALYETISGPAGAARDWQRFVSLFMEGARLIRTEPAPEGGTRAYVFTPEEYAQTAGEYFKQNDFYEREIARRTEAFGNVAHAFSTYESLRSESDAEPFSRGVNSIQLLRDGARWRVVTIFWDFERPDNPIPPQYLPPA